MQESQDTVVTRNAARIVCTSRIGVNPTLRKEFFRRISPEQRRAIDSRRGEPEPSPFGNGNAKDRSVYCCDSGCGGNGWEEAENLVAHCGEIWEGIQNASEINASI